MIQERLDKKKLSEKDRLLELRLRYYRALTQDISRLNRRKIELINNYKSIVNDIDYELRKLK